MKRIAIVGSGHLGQQITHHIHQDTNDVVVGYFDEFKHIHTLVNNIPILGGNSSIEQIYEKGIFDMLIIAIGYKHMDIRGNLFDKLYGHIPFYTFTHSSTIIDQTACIGYGTIVYPGCIIDQHVVIGNNVLLNIGCAIAHDSIIGDHTFLSPRVSIAGFVNIGNNCILGINSTVIDNINISASTQIGGGTVIIKNIDSTGLYVGNPGRYIRKFKI